MSHIKLPALPFPVDAENVLALALGLKEIVETREGRREKAEDHRFTALHEFEGAYDGERGYQYLPNGLLIQGGVITPAAATSGSVDFHKEYQNKIIVVLFTVVKTGAACVCMHSAKPSTRTFTWETRDHANALTAVDAIYWVSFGY